MSGIQRRKKKKKKLIYNCMVLDTDLEALQIYFSYDRSWEWTWSDFVSQVVLDELLIRWVESKSRWESNICGGLLVLHVGIPCSWRWRNLGYWNQSMNTFTVLSNGIVVSLRALYIAYIYGLLCSLMQKGTICQ